MNICLIHKGKRNTSGVEKYLSDLSCRVEEIPLIESGFDVLRNCKMDVIIFDVMNHQGDDNDFLLLKKIQEITKSIPILLATNANESSRYRENMLDGGVDGCIQAPFLQEELHLRLEKLAKKRDTLLFSGTNVSASDVQMDIRSHVVQKNGKEISLTKTEHSILFHLFLHKDTLVSSNQLSECLEYEIQEKSSAVNIHILNIRRKLSDFSLIKTVPHYGFSVSDHFALH